MRMLVVETMERVYTVRLAEYKNEILLQDLLNMEHTYIFLNKLDPQLEC